MPTIGVAVAVPEPWASELYDYRLKIGDPTAEGVPSHITLIPPVEVDDLTAIEQHLAEVGPTIEPFTVHLRGTGTFRPVSPVVFVGLVEGISQCELLAEAVRQGPLAVELGFPYHPHVTVAHHLDDAALDQAFDDLAGFDCRFGVTQFHLYVHDEEEGWKATHTFPLQ